MKILHYIGLGSNKYGGLEKFNINLAQQLSQKGGKLSLIYKRSISCTPYLDEIKRHNINAYEVNSANGYIKFARRVVSILKRERPDIIHLNFNNSIETIIIYLVSRFYGSPKIVTTFHCMPEFKTRRQLIVTDVILRCSNKVLGVSNAIANILRATFPTQSSKIMPLYLGVPYFEHDKEVYRHKYNISNDKVAICTIAYHDPVKGLDVLAEAIHHLKYNLGIDNFVVYQIGGAPFPKFEKKLMERINHLQIDDKFVFMGLRDDVPQILSSCDIYCQPSRSEGIGLSIMEAMIAKLPIVATNVGGIPEIAYHMDNALLCDKESPIALAENLKALIESPQRRVEYGQRGHKRALETLSINNQVAHLISLYNQL